MSAATLLNESDDDRARMTLSNCCAARAWVDGMLARRPFEGDDAVLSAAAEVAATLAETDWLEAFAAHPLIGNVDTLRDKYAATRGLATAEQSGVAAASEHVLQELATLNHAYRKRFGFIFIVFASGKSAQQMLDLLRSRIGNSREEELRNAAKEQLKITELRLGTLAPSASDT